MDIDWPYWFIMFLPSAVNITAKNCMTLRSK